MTMNARIDQPELVSVPFIAKAQKEEPFSELRGRAAVDNPSKMLEGWTLEAGITEWNTVSAALLDILARRRRAVAKVIVPPGNHVDFQGVTRPAGWHGTGFIVARNLLVTNHHVLNSLTVAGAARIEFDYETPPDDLVATRLDGEPGVVGFQLAANRLFVTSEVKGGLDYTFVWIDEGAAERFGIVPMERASFTVREFDPTFIIHHPRGRLKEASLDDTELLKMEGTVLHYAADTDFGSSGAPVFDRLGRLIALHHARTTDNEYTLQDGRKARTANEGIKIASIAIDLENRVRRGGDDAQSAQAVLASIKGSDTLAGFFGGLGRSSVRGASDVEAVVDTYTGTEQDVDIGFWNIEWLSKRWRDQEKLEAVATVIADLNLDIWALSEVSPPAIQALVAALERKYGERYAFDVSEPESGEGKQSTAVIWRTQTVSGAKEAWPAEIEPIWHLDSRDTMPFEAEHGKVFNRYPALYRFNVLGRSVPFDFYLVPLHLKAMDEGGLRRRLASRLLAGAIQSLINRNGYDKDWILGGDFNATLASGDFERLKDAQFVPMSAEDENDGAFTYLKSPRSLIDNIFLSPNVARMSGSRDFFIVAKDRSVDKFVQRVSDHRPVVLRVSLGDTNEASPAQDLDAIAEKLLAGVGAGKPRPDPAYQAGNAAAATPPRAVVRRIAGDPFEWRGLSKELFLTRNRARICQEIDAVNGLLATRYGAAITRLTEHDAWVLTYIEAGLRNGVVDPDFEHPDNERGLLPLPNNIADWNGPGAPTWDQPMPLAVNLHHFYLYLGHLLNKPVRQTPRFMLYRDLFTWGPIAGKPVRQAALLAGAVHGYFVGRNYSDGKVPYDHILDGYAWEKRADAIMQSTRYVHAGKTLMKNRADNIAIALALL